MQQAVRISDKTAFFLMGEIVEFGDTQSYSPCLKINELRTILLGGLDNEEPF